jgi:transcriptional regulator with XRE-family HTH domain
MGRSEQPLGSDGSALRDFALELRSLRRSSNLTYAQLADRASYSTSSLQEAAAGRSLPTLNLTQAFVGACGGDITAWTSYWRDVRRLLDAGTTASGAKQIKPPTGLVNTESHRQTEDGEAWYLESFEVLLLLDGQRPEAIERRVAVSAVDGLSELVTSMSLPRDPEDSGTGHRLETEVLQGGILTQRQRRYESYFRSVIALPHALRAGERHPYTVKVRIPPGQTMSPYYVHVPHRRSDRFKLTVRFNVHHLPSAVWTLPGVPTAVIYERNPLIGVLTPNRIGEVSADFQDLKQGLAYGIAWIV